MKTQLFGAALAALALIPGGTAAQERSFVFTMGNGRIGVMVDMVPHEDSDRYGARIQSVRPESPAAKAGLEAGDIITKFNGTSLGGIKGEDDRSGPGSRLMDLSAKVDPGDMVEVEYRRNGKANKVTIKAENMGWYSFGDSGSGYFSRRFNGRLPEILRMPDWVPGPDVRFFAGPEADLHFSFGGRWGDLELVALNDDLGDYFGTTSGVLVVKAPRDTTLHLKAGDVIQAIDGREVRSPEHAFRIIRSYDGGETAKIQVLRKKQKVTVDWTVPEASGHRMRMERPGGMVRPQRRVPAKRQA